MAYHEAGHAVLATVLGISVESVSMEGRTTYKEDGNVLDRILVTMAGAFAAKRFDKYAFTAWDDIELANKLLPPGQNLEKLQRKSRRLVNQNKKAITIVAKRLILKRTLTGEEVQTIVGFSY